MAQSSQGGTHRRHDAAHYAGTDWEAKEAVCQRELEEARARTAQMEKTMRWWSDCTANWREKWSKVRNERNKAREEAKQLKVKLDIATKELNTVKADMQSLMQVNSEKSPGDIAELTEDGIELRRRPEGASRQRASLDSHKFSNVDNVLSNKLSEMRMKLDDKTKSLHVEREQKAFLLAKIECLTAEVHNLKVQPRNDQTMGSNDSSQSEVERLQSELQDEMAAKQVLAERLAELSMEVERLKSENTVQWSKRELLETENIAILRENNKLYSQVCELREQIHNMNRISDSNHYAIPRLTDKSKTGRMSAAGSQEHSSNGSSEGNLHYDTRNSEDDLAIVEANDKVSRKSP